MNTYKSTLFQTKRIPGFPSYIVTDSGIVFGPRNGFDEPLSSTLRPDGRLWVQLVAPNGTGRHKGIDRLVCMTFNGPSPTPRTRVRHIDGDPRNNRAENLVWAA
ncbi:HNH endonuclease [Streptomyces sp. NBC_00483]|uniref:HNH endonuclease n=1 Tax=Streptomyces sp. NBC_00483 TaxID=2975756 RepID=UPI003FCE22A3